MCVAAHLDYMNTWVSFLDVRNGAEPCGRDSFAGEEDAYGFVTSPMDLARFVYFYALHQTYLNACIIIMYMTVQFNCGMPIIGDCRIYKQNSFATVGGPHVLSLVT